MLIGPSALANADLNELSMNWQDGEIAFEISMAGAFQYTHQIEQAKDGKPFRVIVDLFPAVHKLGQKSFFDLPRSIVKAVRTSQYSVKPTKTVRVVLDLKAESVYRIEKQGSSVFVYIPDDKTTGFATWSSKGAEDVVPEEKTKQPPTVAQAKSKTTEKLAGASTPEPEKEASAELAYQKPKRSSIVEDDLNKRGSAGVSKVAKVAVAPISEPKADISGGPDKSDQLTATRPEKKAEPSQPARSEVKKDAAPTSEKTELAASHDEKLTQDKKPKAADKKKSEPAAEKDLPSQASQTSPVVAGRPAAETGEAKRPTSRFRREPAFPAKLKGTIVAEFPKRMVIKYTPGISRDPFASLFEEAKKTGGPLAKKIPDVETSRLVGVLESVSGENRVLLEDIDGYGFILKPGDKVKKGYLSQVYSDKAIFQLFEYGWSRTIALNLDDIE
jgi:hypothetical protein